MPRVFATFGGYALEGEFMRNYARILRHLTYTPQTTKRDKFPSFGIATPFVASPHHLWHRHTICGIATQTPTR